jgi:hypothetical protein
LIRWPNHRDLYVLIAGLLLGVLLSPGVLGRIAPQTWERFFLDPVTAQQDLIRFVEQSEANRAQVRHQLREIGVTDVAMIEFDEQDRRQRAQLEQRIQRAWFNHGRMIALIFALGIIMVLECIATAPATAARLASVRYAMLALWLALLLAQPAMARFVSMLFVALLVVVALAASFVPLGRRRGNGPAGEP